MFIKNFPLILAFVPGLALAGPVVVQSHVTAVTLYPEMAEVTREVSFTADQAGELDLVVPDLPLGAEARAMRFAATAGVTIGAHALRSDRLPPMGDADSPEIAAARAALKSATAERQDAEAARDAILAKAKAAEAQLAFLGAVKMDGASLSPEALVALSRAVGDQALAATQAAIAARAEALPAEDAVTKAREAEDKAQQALDALLAVPEDRVALMLTVTVDKAGPVTLDITHFVQDAYWRPSYEAALDDKATPPTLVLARSALVSQDTGEDWSGVTLTLSTARPGEQSEPSTLWPELRSIGDPPSQDEYSKSAGADMALAVEAAPAPAPMATASAAFEGVAVVYHLPAAVSVATGVEDLDVVLDRLTFAPEVVAQAVPSRDDRAFVVAKWVNTGAEVLLPGDVLTTRDGTLVGGGSLPLLAPGDKATMGFGALDGMKLKYTVPDRTTGDHGVFTTSTEQSQTSVLSVENLTGQAWPVRLMGQVPYSEQDDLKIDWSAEPMPDETDVDDQRGILAWSFTLAPAEKKEVTVETHLSWPSGKVLQ